MYFVACLCFSLYELLLLRVVGFFSFFLFSFGQWLGSFKHLGFSLCCATIALFEFAFSSCWLLIIVVVVGHVCFFSISHHNNSDTLHLVFFVHIICS